MSVNVVDVKESDIEGIVATVIASLGFESVYFDAIVTRDYRGVGGGDEDDWEKEGNELHRGSTEVTKGQEGELALKKRSRWGRVIYTRRGEIK